MNAKAIIIVMAVCALLVAGKPTCCGEGREESGCCCCFEGHAQEAAAEARLDSAAIPSGSAQCDCQSGHCDC
ncbi:hypothetical protein MTO96_045899 [Rhipicephalus appendiculatus]